MEYQKNKNTLENLLNKYKLTSNEKEYILNTIYDIFIHDEFQRRMTSQFFHHNKITLGEHILEDTIVTYLLAKKDNNNDLAISLKIAMMHDLYECPWQNNPNNTAKYYHNKHGFRHPIEAILNAVYWFPEEFSDKETAEKIIDGVLHHMFPLPVRRFINSPTNEMEINNYKVIEIIDQDLIESIMTFGNRKIMGPFSITPSQYREGRVMSIADKIVSTSNLKGSNIHGYLALLTGKNKNLDSSINKEKAIKKQRTR